MQSREPTVGKTSTVAKRENEIFKKHKRSIRSFSCITGCLSCTAGWLFLTLWMIRPRVRSDSGRQIVRWIRGFAFHTGQTLGTRDLEDAPESMRQELVDLFFMLAEHKVEEISSQRIYPVPPRVPAFKPLEFHTVTTDLGNRNFGVG